MTLYCDLSQMIITYWNDKVSIKMTSVIPESVVEGQLRRYNDGGITFALSPSKAVVVAEGITDLICGRNKGFTIETGTPGNVNEVTIKLDESGDYVLICNRQSQNISITYKFNSVDVKEIKDDGSLVTSKVQGELLSLKRILDSYSGIVYGSQHAASLSNNYRQSANRQHTSNGYSSYQQPQQQEATVTNVSSPDDIFDVESLF
jgi:hypothetical protein